MNKTIFTAANVLPLANSRGIVRRTLITMIIMISAIFMTVIVTLFSIANTLNQQSDLQNQHLLLKALNTRQEAIRTHLDDNANWGEAYTNLHVKLNTKWAWDQQNLGSSLYTAFQFEGVFVLGPEDITRYSVISGKLVHTPFQNWLNIPVLPMLHQRLHQSGGKAISQFAIANNTLVLLAAAEIQIGDDNTINPVPGPPSIMIFVDRLTPEKLREMGLEYGVLNTHIHTRSQQIDSDKPESGFPLRTSTGIISIEWTSSNPGGALLTWVLPSMVFLFFATLFLALALMRHAMLRARMNDESTFLLEQGRMALAASEQRFRDVAETTSDWIWETDDKLCFSWISGSFPMINGTPEQSWIGRPLTTFLLDSQPIYRLTQWASSAPLGSHLSLEQCQYHTPNKQPHYCNLVIKKVKKSDGRQGFRGTANDVTQKVETQARVRYLSEHDELTGLPNRVQMQQFLHQKPLTQLGHDQQIAVLTVDLDKFKPVNDLYGHSVGDKILHDVSARMREHVPDTGLVTRYGGDEFIIILPTTTGSQEPERLSDALLSSLTQAFHLEDSDVFIGASIGIAIAPLHSTNVNDLLRYSDIALYQAKHDGRNCWRLYHPSMEEQIIQRRELENELRDAIHTGQLHLVYQPRHDVRTGKVTTIEALIRWQHPRLGLLLPDQFIPLAEDTGLIFQLSDWVLATACRDAAIHFDTVSVAVNISAIEFRVSGFVSRIHHVLTTSGLSPSRLEIEISENTALSDPDRVTDIMLSLKSIGVRFLIDDFGAGYASLSYLHGFPFDGIKLDKSFVIPTDTSENARRVVENIVGLGKACSLHITAEGVETREQLTYLESLRCDALQGYLIGRPVPLKELKQCLNE
ncbi:EAL domain-containing protein [Mangrovibacter sp. SLW1]